ncbi:unnamed protein product, partial [Laminaria digitata]
DPVLATSGREAIATSGMERVSLVEQSPDSASLDERVDLIVADVTSTWFIEGEDVEVLNHLTSRVLKPGGVMIPRRVVHLFELSSAPNQIGDFALRAPRFTRPGEPVAVLSESKHFLTQTIGALEPLPTEIDDTLFVRPLLSGTVTGLRLRTLCELAENVTQVTSAAGVQSILVPLQEDVTVVAGQPISLHIRYETGAGLLATRWTARAMHPEEERPLGEAQREITSAFEARVEEMVSQIDAIGRGSDLDKIVGYTRLPQGDVSRLTALFWTVDEEFRVPLKAIVDEFKAAAASAGVSPSDDLIYERMYAVYKRLREAS